MSHVRPYYGPKILPNTWMSLSQALYDSAAGLLRNFCRLFGTELSRGRWFRRLTERPSLLMFGYDVEIEDKADI